jgi:hypothetical protein
MTSNSRWRWCWCWGWWWWWCRCDGDAPPYAKEESMVSIAAISLWRLQQISPSGGGRRVSPLPPPQKITWKLGRPFSDDTESSIRRRKRGDHRGPNGSIGRRKPDGISPFAMGAHTTNTKPTSTARRTRASIYRGVRQPDSTPFQPARPVEKERSGSGKTRATLKAWVRREKEKRKMRELCLVALLDFVDAGNQEVCQQSLNVHRAREDWPGAWGGLVRESQAPSSHLCLPVPGAWHQTT